MEPLPRFRLRIAPDDILHQQCKLVLPGEDVTELCAAMKQIALEEHGAGLAAPQVGSLARVILLRPNGERGTILINPVVTKASDKMIPSKEGCLSYPFHDKLTGFRVVAKIKRHRSMTVRYENEERQLVTIKFRGFEACVLQHELDHLNGRCVTEEAWINAGRPLNQPTGVVDAMGDHEISPPPHISIPLVSGALGAHLFHRR